MSSNRVHAQDWISKGWYVFPFIIPDSDYRQEQDNRKANLKRHFKEHMAGETESTQSYLAKISATYLYKTFMHGDTAGPNPLVAEKYISKEKDEMKEMVSVSLWRSFSVLCSVAAVLN